MDPLNQSFILPWTKDILFIQEQFAGQKNKSGIPHWLHSVDVMQRAQMALQHEPQVNNKLFKEASLMALGHDLLEDTSVTLQEIKKRWGPNVLAGIQDLTKKAADGENAQDYFTKLQQANEIVRLVKIADIWSNVSTSLQNFDVLEGSWMETVWLPLLNGYTKLYNLPWKELTMSGEFITRQTKAGHDELIHRWQTRIENAQ